LDGSYTDLIPNIKRAKIGASVQQPIKNRTLTEQFPVI